MAPSQFEGFEQQSTKTRVSGRHIIQKKAVLFSNHDASFRPSPRSRYNSAFVSKLLKRLETDPEADLDQDVSKYSRRRLKELRGASTIVQPITEAKQEARDTTPVRPPIPEPCGNFGIISPLAPQVKTLIGLNSSDASNIPLDLPTNLWRLLRDGEVLHQVFSRWVIRLSSTIVVKFAPDLDISEIQTMCYIWQHRGIIPMPEPLGALSIGKCHYIFMSYLEGVALAELWPHLTPDLKTSVQSQLGEILHCLRKVPLQSKYLGSGNPPRCRDLRRNVRASPGSISNEMEFNAFLTSTQRELNPVYLELCTSKLSTGHRIVMTHSDIRPDNILVLYTAPHTIKITGLIDWEVSGAYPEYWEYLKALSGVNCSLSDWYSYLPTDVIGNHSDAWRQDCFVSRMVL